MDLSKHNAAQQSGWKAINRVAAAQFFIYPVAESGSKKQLLSDEGKKAYPGCTTMYEALQREHTWDFMVMGNYIRLGGELEVFLAQYYADKAGIPWRNIEPHLPDKKFRGSVFQRTRPSPKNKNTVIDLFLTMSTPIDLTTMSHFRSIQEYWVHRHLYVHQNGLVDSDYLDQIEEVLGKTERDRIQALVLKTGGAATRIEDVVVYWFEPLRTRFSALIDEAKKFVLELPV